MFNRKTYFDPTHLPLRLSAHAVSVRMDVVSQRKAADYLRMQEDFADADEGTRAIMRAFIDAGVAAHAGSARATGTQAPVPQDGVDAGPVALGPPRGGPAARVSRSRELFQTLRASVGHANPRDNVVTRTWAPVDEEGYNTALACFGVPSGRRDVRAALEACGVARVRSTQVTIAAAAAC